MPAEKITKEKIINALLNCAFEKSTGATSLADISDKLGIKKASLYNHFENREDIIEGTIRYCADTLSKTSLIPPEMDSAAQKYSAETILKGIVNRWFKLNTKEPLFHIYTFLQGEKYFSSSASMAFINFRNRLTEQSCQALKALSKAQKIKPFTDEQLKSYSEIFVSLLNDILDTKLIVLKSELRFNPEYTEEDFSEIDQHIANFCELLK